ncbi:MAG: PhoH family protein, partial [Steroidobacteraceae bacterium]
MHDPAAIFRFAEHDIYLPMVVLEELDANKKGLSEASRNTRQASRFLDDMIRGVTKAQIDAGLPIPSARTDSHGKQPPAGRLFFQTRSLGSGLPDNLPGHGADNLILGQTLALQKEHPQTRVVLVSKDINLRIKAAVVGVHAEDYYSDKTIEDADVLYTGCAKLPADFWEQHGRDMRSWKEGDRTWYELTGPAVADWHVNEFVYEDSAAGIEALVRRMNNGAATLELVRDFRSDRHSVWGITARNREQNFAVNMLMDPDIDFVTLLGNAGTGKTLLALATGLAQVMDQQRYRE